MNYYYTDEEIKALLDKEKSYSGTIEDMMNFSELDGHKRASIELPDTDW
ncbi:MAG: hypothetical protein IIB95_13755 [Candidatus Marinimicrobia bacterium]|nr:hypothetical protein [Candidatus Neomarinimicrobiota bacterium]